MSDKYSEHLIADLTKTGKNYDLEKITRAYEYARELHAGQFRKDARVRMEPDMKFPGTKSTGRRICR